MTPDQVKQQVNDRFSSILAEVGGFFAFSNSQFKEQAKANIKYCRLSSGLILPKTNVDLFKKRLKEMELFSKCLYAKVDRSILIEYELTNHECYYTGDISDAFDVLKECLENLTVDEVYKVYKNNRDKFDY